jgi:hypothetical protein
MSKLPIVIGYHVAAKRRPLECMCIECGATAPTFRIPKRYVCTGLKPIIYAAALLHAGLPMPAVIHDAVQVTP